MPPSQPGTRKASTAVPGLMQFFLLYLEPLFTIGGVLLILTNPSQYANTMTRGLQPRGGASDWVWTELAGGWLHVLFTEAVVLRLVDDLKVWRLLCMGILLSDALYTHSVAQAVGGVSAWVLLERVKAVF